MTRRQLERQAWAQLDSARRATELLIAGEGSRLDDLTTLLVERPTLQRLMLEENWVELNSYLDSFRRQSDLDFLGVCDQDDRPLVGSEQARLCELPSGYRIVLLEGLPALVATRVVQDGVSDQLLGTALTGIWIDEGYLQELAAATGTELSVLLPGAGRLASSLGAGVQVIIHETTAGEPAAQRTRLTAGERPFFATHTSPTAIAGGDAFTLEVALPVDALTATERQALLVMVGSTTAVAILAAVLGIWYVRQLVAPLQQLTAAAQRVSDGDLTAAIPTVMEPREISTLATALQHSQASMLDALRERSEARDWLNALVQSIIEGVITINGAGRITFFSQGAELISGWSAREALGHSLGEVLPLTEDGDQSALAKLCAQGGKQRIAIHNRAGNSVVLAVTCSQLVGGTGEEGQSVLVIRDVTEEEALRNLRAYFLANISHEFRTPLSTLVASMELLLDPQEKLRPEEMRQLLKPGYLSLRALQTLIDNLLESSSIEAGQFHIHKRPVNVDAVIENAVLVVGPLLERRSQPISIGEPGSLPPIEADAGRLTQALVNLLANASKYSPIGQPIEVRVTHEEGYLRIAVADRGSGIAPGDRDNVFRRFVRGVASDGEQYGVGLGLYVVKQVVEAHDGRVGVDERPEGGSVFWFELPLEQRIEG